MWRAEAIDSGEHIANQIAALKRLRQSKGEYIPWRETSNWRRDRLNSSGKWVETGSGRSVYGRGYNFHDWTNGDCVTRALVNAGEGDYNDIWQSITHAINPNFTAAHGVPTWSEDVFYARVGFDKNLRLGDTLRKRRVKVNEFMDEMESGKDYLLHVSDRAGGEQISHVVYARDGRYVDSWDSGEWYIKDLYIR